MDEGNYHIKSPKIILLGLPLECTVCIAVAGGSATQLVVFLMTVAVIPLATVVVILGLHLVFLVATE